MPYFQRKPIAELNDTSRSQSLGPPEPEEGGPIPGLPSRGPAPGSHLFRRTFPIGQGTPGTGIAGPASVRHSGLAAGLPDLDTTRHRSASAPGAAPRRDGTHPIVAPAPVLCPSGPIAPGGSAQTMIALVNEDDRPARIVFFNTSLIGEDGAHIPIDHVSFHPRELTLSPGSTGEVLVHVIVPSNTPCGVYSGLIRGSPIDHLHAVLMVRVEPT